MTILYCCWATPPEYRTDSYDSPDVADAVRACSNILALLADRWPRAECLRDVFELLAREVPLVDRPRRPPTRVSEAAAAALRGKLAQVRALIVHRSIMRMLEEMATEDFPRLRGSGGGERTPRHLRSGASRPREREPATMTTGPASTATTPTLPFAMPFAATPLYDGDVMPAAEDDASLPLDEFLAYPGLFDMDGTS